MDSSTNDDDDAAIGDGVALAVRFEVVTDFGALGQIDVTVNDGVANARVAADVDVIEDDGIFDFAVAVYANIVAQDGVCNAPARNDRATGNHGIDSDAHAIGIGENEFRGRILLLPGAERPALVVQIENRRHGTEIDVRFVVGVDCADVAPVLRFPLYFRRGSCRRRRDIFR